MPEANPYLETLQAPAATGAGPGNPYLDMLQSAESMRKTQTAAAVSQAVSTNPDEFAKQKRVAQYLGYPLAAVAAMPDITKRQAQAQQVQQDIAASPVLQQRFTDADFARLAHDDTGVLSSLASAIGYVVSAPGRSNTLMGDIGAGVARAAQGAAGVFQGAAELPAPLLDWLEPVQAVGGNPLRRLAEGFATQGATAARTAERLSPPQAGTLAGGISSGVQSLTTNALALPMALFPGGQGAALTMMTAQTGGQSYQQAREQGVPMSQALPFAASQAAIEFATEKIPLARLIGDVKVSTPFFQTLARQAALEVPGEQIATVLQDMNEWAVLPENAGKSFSEYLAARPNAAAQTLIATLVGTGGNVTLTHALAKTLGAHLDGEERRALAEQDAEQLKRVFGVAAQSALRERDPDGFATLVQDMADEAPDAPKEVRFDARQFAETLQQSGLPEEELRAMLPTAFAQIDEAMATGGEVTVPVGEFSKVIGTPLDAALMQHARIGDNELSQAEGKQAGEQAAAMLKTEAENVAAQAGGEAAQRVAADSVKSVVLDQLNTAGRFTPDVNSAYASLVRDFYVTMAGRLKTTPDELFARYPLSVRAEGVGPLEQGEMLDLGDLSSLMGADPGSTQNNASGESAASLEAQSRLADEKARDRPRYVIDTRTGAVRPLVGVDAVDTNAKAGQVIVQKNVGAAEWTVLSSGPDVTRAGALASVGRGRASGALNQAADQTETPEFKRRFGSRGTFDPNDPNDPNILAQGPRGTFNPATLTITLLQGADRSTFLQGADLSTFLHETGHFFLDMMWRFASDPQAPADVTADMAAVFKWFKTTPEQWATWTEQYNATGKVPAGMRKQHERFAEGFEQYLLEGKAPSIELQPLFSKFRSWLMDVYTSLKDFLAGRDEAAGPAGKLGQSANRKIPLGLTDEVRGVFDRLLASREQIASAEALRNFNPLNVPGMAPAARAGYEAAGAKATDKALDTMSARSIKDMRWLTNAHSKALKALQRDTAAKHKEVESEVRAEVAKEPVRQAIRWLRRGEMTTAEGEQIRAEKGFRLNTEALAEMYPESMLGRPDLEKLKGLTAGNGLHPDVVASMFGFSSGDELVHAVIDAEPEASVIEGMTDRRMLERYGDLATEAGMQRAADEAVHNEARGRFMATGLKALQDAQAEKQKTPRGGSVSVMVRAAKDFATQLVARRKVRELRAGQHTAAEARAGKAAQKALTKGDVAGAITAQRDQLLNHYAARETYAALDEVEKALAYLKKFDKEAVRKKLPPEYQDQIDKLLERVELRQRTLRELDKRAKLADWIKSQEDLGIEVQLPPEVAEDVQLTNYKDMTLEAFRGLVDTVRQVEHLGRLKSKLLTAKDQREFDAIKDSIVASILANSQGRTADTRTPTSNLGRTLAAIKDFGAAHIKVATWARVMDGGKDGPVWEFLVRPANAAGDQETTMLAKATQDLATILAPVLARGKMGGSGRFFQSIGRSMNRESVLAIALNTGNESNLQRLLDGEGWTADQIKPLLDTLSPEDLKAVQQVWDYFESYRPQIAAKELRVFGREPEWIEPGSSVAEAYGLRGGYYPVKYDPKASVRAEEHADAEGAKRQLQGAYGAATTRRSFTKSRVDQVFDRPILYTLQGVYSGVTDVVHDLAWHEWLIDANRLLKNRSIDAAIRNTYGPEAVRQFKAWRDDIADGGLGPQRTLDSWLGYLRQSVSVAGLGFNVVSAMMQPLGLAQSIQRVGAKWIAKGVWQTIGSPVKASKAVNEKSAFMTNRARTRFRELNELRNKVQGQNALQRAVSENAYFLMMAFQRLVDVPTWQGAYERAISEGNDEARAVALADQAVIDAQGNGQTKDLAAIERGPQALKLFTTFYSFMNLGLNLGVASKMSPGSRAKFAADMLLLYTVPAVLGSILKDAFTPGDAGDDEELAKKLAGEQLSYLLGLVVIGREFGQAGQTLTGANAYDYTGPAGLRAIADTYRFAKQAGQGEFDDSFRKAAVNLAGDFLGLPSAQINRTITGVQALAEGKTQNPAAVALGYQEPR
jgi:hypothetical protein